MQRLVPVSLVLCLLAAPAAAADLELHVLDCGTMHGVETETFLPGVDDPPEYFDMTNRCFVVVHPKGTLLWDAGFPTGFGPSLITWWLWLSSFGKTNVDFGPLLVAQLEERGMSPEDIDYVALSHSHFDHVGQAEAFAGSTWLVQKTERDWLFDAELENEAVDPSYLEALRDSETVELTGDHDVFGDGSVRILSAPGHTPGHQCLFLDLKETGPIVLSGDLYHSRLNRELRVAPSFNTDEPQTQESMTRIEAFLKESGAELWIQHAPESGVQAPATVR